MLVECVNMQLEAELADLLDRKMTALYGIQQKNGTHPKKEEKANKEKLPAREKFLATNGIDGSDSMIVSDSEGEDTVQGQIFPKIDNKSAISVVDSSKLPVTITSFNGLGDQFNETVRFNNKALSKINHLEQQMPIKIDQKCLSCNNNSHDPELTTKLFKIACLSYKPNDLEYRGQTMSRIALIGLRRDLIEKITRTLPNSTLFRDNIMYPRRYFDDMVLEQKAVQQHT